MRPLTFCVQATIPISFFEAEKIWADLIEMKYRKAQIEGAK